MINVMDRVGCPVCGWLLCAIFTLMLFCHIPNANREILLALQTGQALDISKLMHFHFCQEVLVESHGKDKKEELRRWCYPAEGVSNELMCMALLTKTKKPVSRSNVQPATNPLYPNLRKQPHTNIPLSSPSPTSVHVETVPDENDEDDTGNSP